MMRIGLLLVLVLLAGCGASAPLIAASIGLVAGELKLGTAVFEYLAVKDALPPDCQPGVPLPCVMRR